MFNKAQFDLDKKHKKSQATLADLFLLLIQIIEMTFFLLQYLIGVNACARLLR